MDPLSTLAVFAVADFFTGIAFGLIMGPTGMRQMPMQLGLYALVMALLVSGPVALLGILLGAPTLSFVAIVLTWAVFIPASVITLCVCKRWYEKNRGE